MAGYVNGLSKAVVELAPGGLVAWLLIGLLAGATAAFVMKGGGYGVIGDLFTGLVGAVVGGFLFGLVAQGTTGFWGSLLVAFIGACVLIAVLRFVGRRRVDV